MLQEHPTFWVLDSTKIQDYAQCPRMYFFKFILGWSAELPSVHLEYGIAMHLALEYLLLNGYSTENVWKAWEIFDAAFQENYVSICGDEHKKKNSGNTFYSLGRYVSQYLDDLEKFRVIHTEVAGSVMIDADKKLYFRMDTICEGSFENLNGFFSIEHKTGTTLNRQWKDKWTQKTQVGAYSHVMNCLYPRDKVLGIVINGFFPDSPPQLKKDGTPYANATDAEFYRRLVHKTNLQMEDWCLNTIDWYDSIIVDTQKALAVKDEPVMTCFRKQTENCDNFFGCPYSDFCHAWTNPIMRGAEPQGGFVKKFWDPRTLVDKAKEKVEL